MITFLLTENQDRQPKDLQQADLAVYLKDFFFSKDEVDEWDFFKLKITSIIVFVIMIKHLFPSWALSPTHCAIFIGELCISWYSFIDKVGFSRQ